MFYACAQQKEVGEAEVVSHVEHLVPASGAEREPDEEEEHAGEQDHLAGGRRAHTRKMLRSTPCPCEEDAQEHAMPM